jgi:hypothetical protein
MRSRVAHRSRGGTGVAWPPGGEGTGMVRGRCLSGSRVAVFATLAAIVDLFEVLRQGRQSRRSADGESDLPP